MCRAVALALALCCLAASVPAARGAMPAAPGCTPLDAQLAALQATADPPGTPLLLKLQPGCSTVSEDSVCQPWNRSMVLQGAGRGGAAGGSTWDTRFALYQFTLQEGGYAVRCVHGVGGRGG